jgi:hypothetical protein
MHGKTNKWYAPTMVDTVNNLIELAHVSCAEARIVAKKAEMNNKSNVQERRYKPPTTGDQIPQVMNSICSKCYVTFKSSAKYGECGSWIMHWPWHLT